MRLSSASHASCALEARMRLSEGFPLRALLLIAPVEVGMVSRWPQHLYA